MCLFVLGDWGQGVQRESFGPVWMLPESRGHSMIGEADKSEAKKVAVIHISQDAESSEGLDGVCVFACSDTVAVLLLWSHNALLGASGELLPFSRTPRPGHTCWATG